jgi:hypothetical protein
MIRNLICLLFLTLPFKLLAQCADSSRIDLYYRCYESYAPQCGCDGKTYRSPCAADFWGGLVVSHSYQPGVCGNFDIDFAPNPVSQISSTIQDAFLHIYINDNQLPSSAQVYLFDVYNRLQYSRYFYVTFNPTPSGISDDKLNADFFASLQKGVYILVVTVNGESKVKKIVKVNIQ